MAIMKRIVGALPLLIVRQVYLLSIKVPVTQERDRLYDQTHFPVGLTVQDSQ